MKIETWNIKGYDVEFIEDGHIYLVNGIIVPSITTILKIKFGNKYKNIPQNILNNAAKKGTEMHQAIQDYEEKNIESDLKELKNYKFLKRQYKWECLENEVPVILFKDEKPIACGRIDMTGKIKGEVGGFDFKRTSSLDKDYLKYQLNLYRIAYRQCYGVEWQFLKGLHLREDTRRFIDLPINENMAWSLINEYLAKEK